MAFNIFTESAALAAKVTRITATGTWNGSETNVAVILKDENGNQQTVNCAITSATTTTQAAEQIQSALAAETSQTLFIANTYTQNVAAVSVTSNVAGTPHYVVSANVTGGTGTTSVAVNTANGSPHDWADTDNWSQGAVPSSSDDVVVAGRVFFGLDQSAVALTTLKFQGFGMAGDAENGFALLIDSVQTEISGSGAYYHLKGDLDTVTVSKVTAGAEVRLQNDIDDLLVYGQDVRGKVIVHTGSALDNLRVIGTGSAEVEIESSVTALSSGSIYTDSGVVVCRSAAGTVTVVGSLYKHETGNLTTLNAERGATVEWNAGGDAAGDAVLSTANVYASTLTTRNNENAAATWTTTTVYGAGTIDISGSVAMTLTNNIDNKGGGTVTTSANTTVAKS